jgi:hypothetical protein
MDDPDIKSRPEVWAKKSLIVRQFTLGQKKANDAGYSLHMLRDGHAKQLLRGTYNNKIPDWYQIDPQCWPAQGYLQRFLLCRAEATEDVTEAAVHLCKTVQDQLQLIGSLPGWPAVATSGLPVKPFLDATMHVIQLQFFGIPAAKVSTRARQH